MYNERDTSLFVPKGEVMEVKEKNQKYKLTHTYTYTFFYYICEGEYNLSYLMSKE